MSPRVLGYCILLAIFANVQVARAQEAPSPGAPPVPDEAVQARGDLQKPELKQSVNLVNVYLSIYDKGGYVTDLQKNNCAIDEDKVPQKIRNLTFEKGLPLTIGLLLDTSASQPSMLPFQRAATLFLDRLMTQHDQAFLISFDSNVDLQTDLTSSAQNIDQGVVRATATSQVGAAAYPLVGGQVGGQISGQVGGQPSHRTLLYDAVYLAAREELDQAAGRKVLMVVTTGSDRGSQTDLKSAIAAAQKADTAVYVLLLPDKTSTDRRDAYSAMVEMDRLARETGGRLIDVGRNERKLNDAFTQIEQELRAQYLASYTSTNPRGGSPLRQLHIKCGRGEKVQVQRAYYALDAEAGDE